MEMLTGTWIDKAEPWEVLGIEQEIWEPAAYINHSLVSSDMGSMKNSGLLLRLSPFSVRKGLTSEIKEGKKESEKREVHGQDCAPKTSSWLSHSTVETESI